MTTLLPRRASPPLSTGIVRERPSVAERVRVSVVIPTLNEARNLPHVLALLPSNVHEVLVVDGLSTDGTVDVARRLRADVRIVRQVVPGKGAALRSGFHEASGDAIVAIDADGSTNPEEIPAFVGLLLSGADVVVGSRFLQGGGTADMEVHRRLGNRVLTGLVRRSFGARYSDLCYGFFAFWRDVLGAVDAPCTGFEIETLLHIRAARAGLRVAEVPSFESRRLHGESNLSALKDGLRILGVIATESYRARARPPRTATRASRPPRPALSVLEADDVIASVADAVSAGPGEADRLPPAG